MMYFATCFARAYDPIIAALALAFCCIGSLSTASILVRLRDATRAFQVMWLMVAGVAAGATTWCSHFIAMLAFRPPGVDLDYDVLLTAVSLLAVVYGSKAAFWIATYYRGWFTTVLGGVLLGGSITAMHYTGMAAVTSNAVISWNIPWIILSVSSALGFGIASIACVIRLSGKKAIFLGALFFLLMIVGVHALGMVAYEVRPTMPLSNSGETSRGLALFVVVIGFLVILPGLIADKVEQRANREATEKLLMLAMFDQLTGLPNRTQMVSYLGDRITEAAERKSHLAVVTIDLAQFKDINELRGYETGDTVLKTVAGRMKASLLPGEFVARSGADEFVAIKALSSNDMDRVEATAFAERLHDTIGLSIDLGDDVLCVGSNLGIAFYPQDGETSDEILGRADMAVRRIKGENRIYIGFFAKQPDGDKRADRRLVEDMRRAISEGGFEIVYEPQMDLSTRKIGGYSAGVIWNHPELGTLRHSQFLPQAESTGMILAIRQMILRKACIEAASWTDGATVSVRLSPMQFDHVDVVALVKRTLGETDLEPARLEIEVGEGIFCGREKRNLAILDKLRKIGVKVAISRFGCGDASLAILGEFPFDRIGIEGNIIQGLPNELRSRMMVTAVISAARQLGIPVIADGVETEEQKVTLIEFGCDLAQGPAIAPLRSDENHASVIDKMRAVLFGDTSSETDTLSLGGPPPTPAT